MKTELFGFYSYEPVIMEKQWCPNCTKSRLHEVLNEYTICVICGFKNDPAPPAFQIARYLNEEASE